MRKIFGLGFDAMSAIFFAISMWHFAPLAYENLWAAGPLNYEGWAFLGCGWGLHATASDCINAFAG